MRPPLRGALAIVLFAACGDGSAAVTGPVTLRYHPAAGTATREGRLVTAGGRVLGVTAAADTLDRAIATAYAAIGEISFDGMHYRKDIGRRRKP